MPVYEYICHKCGLKFDFLVRGNTDTISCTRCSSKDLKRLISTFAFAPLQTASRQMKSVTGFASKEARGNIAASSAKNCSGCMSHNCSSC